MLAPRESFSVSSLAALRELSAIKPKSNMTKTQAEVVLSSFVAKGWLLKSKFVAPCLVLSCSMIRSSFRRGRYSLSTRSLLELLPYLKSTYPEEIVECTICMEVIFLRSSVIYISSFADNNSRSGMLHGQLQDSATLSLLCYISA